MKIKLQERVKLLFSCINTVILLLTIAVIAYILLTYVSILSDTYTSLNLGTDTNAKVTKYVIDALTVLLLPYLGEGFCKMICVTIQTDNTTEF